MDKTEHHNYGNHTDNESTEAQGNLLGRLGSRITTLRDRFRRPKKPDRPITLRPRTLRLLVILIVGNLGVLALLTFALYQAVQSPKTIEAVRHQIITATPLASPTPGPTPTPLGSGGAIAFTLRRDGNADIYALNQKDRQLVQLTHDPAEDRDPAWSPDGQHIAFASNRAENWDIYLLDLASGVLIRLTHDPEFDANPTWSPDGQWIAFESYRYNNLDIYMMSTTGEQTKRLTIDRAPDYAPSWSPDSNAIAFTSFRDDNKDIYLVPLNDDQGEAVNITHSSELNEDCAAWSPDGSQLAYASGPEGNPSIQVTTFDIAPGSSANYWDTMKVDQAQTELFGAGDSPAWSPDGENLIYTYRRDVRSHIVAASMRGWALFHEVYNTEGTLDDLAWAPLPLSPRILDQAQVVVSAQKAPFYVEILQPTPTQGPPYKLVPLPNVEHNDGENALLSDRVNESFNALRQRTIEEAGWDFLGKLRSSWRPITYTPPSGHSRRNWHICGRAIGLDPEPYEEKVARVELVREDMGNVTYWRVFLRAATQDGSTGEPLRETPWDLNAREEEGPSSVEGGAYKHIPAGYYVDFTTIASDYGWERLPSLWRWRYFWPDIRWWEFQKTDDLTWWDCMLEIFEPDEIEPVFGPIPGLEGSESSTTQEDVSEESEESEGSDESEEQSNENATPSPSPEESGESEDAGEGNAEGGGE